MNRIRYRIAFLAGSSVILTVLIVMVIFNITVRNKRERDAYLSLNSLKESFGQEYQPDTMAYDPETIIIPDQDNEDNGTVLYTLKEKSILDWYMENGADEVTKASIDGSTYYILDIQENEIDPEMIYTFGTFFISETSDTADDKNSEISIYYDESINHMLAYVDITGELKMINRINFFFVLTALLIGTLSTVSGFFIGRKLEQNQLAQKQFFENTSHELKTPLTAIQGYAEGIEKGIITDLPKTGRVIAAQTSKMSRMIEEILCISRIENGALKLEKEELILDEFIQDCMMPFEGTVRNKALDVRLELKPVKISADTDRLDHAVSNLLINALKYANTFVHVSCDNKGISISNDCPPIPDDTLKHIFDRFYTGRDGNTGIGLALAREIIELHGWHISAGRTADGIEFRIEFD